VIWLGKTIGWIELRYLQTHGRIFMLDCNFIVLIHTVACVELPVVRRQSCVHWPWF